MYWLLRSLAVVVGNLSPALLDRWAHGLAWLLFEVVGLRRAVVLNNLAVAFPEKSAEERRRIGRASYYHFALTTFEFLRSSRTDLAATVTLRNDHHIRAALAEGRGVYVLCMHLGNWEAMGAACTNFVAPSHVLVKKVGSHGVDRFVAELRAKNGFLTVKRQQKGDGMKAIAEVLTKGEIVGFVMDQARPGEPKLPFFGRPAKTNTSFAAIWRRHPAPIVPAFPTRLGISQHSLEFFAPLALTTTGDAAADVTRLSTEFNAVVERCVRQCPEQYFWLHNRWK